MTHSPHTSSLTDHIWASRKFFLPSRSVWAGLVVRSRQCRNRIMSSSASSSLFFGGDRGATPPPQFKHRIINKILQIFDLVFVTRSPSVICDLLFRRPFEIFFCNLLIIFSPPLEMNRFQCINTSKKTRALQHRQLYSQDLTTLSIIYFSFCFNHDWWIDRMYNIPCFLFQKNYKSVEKEGSSPNWVVGDLFAAAWQSLQDTCGVGYIVHNFRFDVSRNVSVISGGVESDL